MHSAVKKVAEDLSLSRENLSLEEVEKAIRTLLLWVGENPDREGLLETPKRIAKVYKELFSGYGESVDEILGVVFEEVAGYDEPVIVKDISFYSHCEHHMIPIIGKAHVAYLPDKKIVGLSKIARVVDVFAHRLQTQETMTAQVANSLKKYLKPRGLAVLIEAEHMCMAMRGVQKQGAATITTSFHGYYKKDQVAQANFMTITRGIR
ncbi:GTP cyclohydrolase 1 [Bartonella bacilliformis str. Heidi Mejia]|uniref:GTP cyclohydrolase I FolE n=1 Tax=Bartonella bacilliformis TaxID=774 RepID=UPI000446EEF2|nr:GTP cyclohydrolase I FolE [Bartonella bacilliformis]EYS92084.1 GTP cyclohydrolase 1 [Bartonella bacilliformis str. Heidi Mejia]KEG18845.1 GTP cyclohydrolase 1 [Bartonella bacilliformis Hosp800-02]KEG23953.1 GTP cyclohydrolase 1 [Bartonella bacilliformis VAB9028]KEG24302.1 GTP cyclohydrolase 1 [Bartonella bacilliformis CAR600-02]